MKNLWLRLGPKYQRWVVIGGVLAVLGVIAFFSSSSPPKTMLQANGKQKNTRHIFTDRSPHETGIDQLAASVKSLSRQTEQLQETVSLLQKSLSKEGKKVAAQEADVNTKMKLIEQQIGAIFEKSHARSTAGEHFNQLEQQQQNYQGGQGGSDPAKQAPGARLKIITHSAARSKKEDKKEGINKAKRATSSLPAGSILSGILINGMDAPTTQAARREPVPSLVRLQLDAILPNLARSDIKECFLLLSGYGDISAERAYLRGETISCVCEDGSSIEEPLDGYAVGEDGKVGVRGRVVSKQGRAIANSMMAGFLGGAASAFDVNPVPSINLDGGNKTVFQSALSQEVFQGAAVKGAGQAMDRVAKFYLEMAENLFPVIEVDAGRQIDIVVKKGSKF